MGLEAAVHQLALLLMVGWLLCPKILTEIQFDILCCETVNQDNI